MRSLIPLLCLAAACGGSSSNSLTGVGSFSPNGSVALRILADDGTIAPYAAGVVLVNSTPTVSCEVIDAGLPTNGVIRGEVDILMAQSPALAVGAYSITDPSTFGETIGTQIPTSGIASVTVYSPTNPPTDQSQKTETSVSGSLTLTKVGTEWAGNFTATMAIDGGTDALSGSFDTSNMCVSQD
jgi:hypothetical protein